MFSSKANSKKLSFICRLYWKFFYSQIVSLLI